MDISSEIVTRMAPTVSGQLHLGSLFNGILNYLYAKKLGGRFKLRLDGHLIRGSRIQDRDAILKDLDIFGLHYDEVIHQADRLSEHNDAFKRLVADQPEKFYFCDCSINDIAARNIFQPYTMTRLQRPEKYPRPCRLQRISVFDCENNDVALGKPIFASSEARDRKAEILTSGNGSYHDYWCNTDIGNSHATDANFLVIDLKEKTWVYAFELEFREYPFLDYQIYLEQNDEWQAVARVNKPAEHFVEPRPSVPYPVGWKERLNFAPVYTSRVKIDITRLPLPLDRPYHYDFHCKHLNKKLDWADLKTVVRCHYDPTVVQRGLDFISRERVPRKEFKIDTAAWFDGKTDLVFSSPYDDKKMNCTHVIRGNDIYPFYIMEVMLAKILDYNPLYYYHPMIVDSHGVKYSKFIKSPSISSYLSGKIKPGMILGYIAWKTGLVEDYPGDVLLDDLVKVFSLRNLPREDILIDDKEMVDFLSVC